jgi:uncharacterized membrane protein YfcA
MEIILAIAIGCAAGLTMKLVGVGGGAIIIFSLLHFLHFPQKMAQGTTLFIVAAPITLLAAYKYYQHGLVNFRVGGIVMVSFLVFSLIGTQLTLHVSDEILKKILGCIIILMGFKITFF